MTSIGKFWADDFWPMSPKAIFFEFRIPSFFWKELFENGVNRLWFVHAAVFSSVLPGIPEEVIKSLWEKGMKFRSELIDVNTSKPEFKNIPYSKENLYLFGYELLRDYLRIAEVNSSSESYNPKIRERLVDLIKLYPGKV